MQPLNPEDHLSRAIYKFTDKEFRSIIDDYFFKVAGLPNIDFSLGIDDEDNQARINFWDFQDTGGIWEILQSKIPNIEEDYYLPIQILEKYMKTSVLEVKGYFTGYAETELMTYYVEVDADRYVAHDSIHEWGF